jgi:hypothetical protein
MLQAGRSLPGCQAGRSSGPGPVWAVAMGPRRASPEGRLRYTWGDVVLTLAGVLATLYAMGKANRVAEQGGSVVPFWVAYATQLSPTSRSFGSLHHRLSTLATVSNPHELLHNG